MVFAHTISGITLRTTKVRYHTIITIRAAGVSTIVYRTIVCLRLAIGDTCCQTTVSSIISTFLFVILVITLAIAKPGGHTACVVEGYILLLNYLWH